MRHWIAAFLLVAGLSHGRASAAAGDSTLTGEGTAAPATVPNFQPIKTEEELEKLAEPIALYPDPLLSVLLPAAAYPLEIAVAARFVTDTNNLTRIDEQDWDANVKAVARFPEVLKKMDTELPWTVAIGQVFVNQPVDFMNAIQTLRTKAHARGTLKTTSQQTVVVTNAVVERMVEQQVVYVTNTVVEIQPSNAQLIYVPQYSPSAVYATPTEVVDPVTDVVMFGAGIALGAAILNNCDWHYGGIYVGGGGMVIVGGGGGGHSYHPPPPGFRPPPYHPPPGYRPPPPGSRPPGYPPPRPYSASASTTPANGPHRWQPDQKRAQTSAAASQFPAEARGWDRADRGDSGLTGDRSGGRAGNFADRAGGGPGRSAGPDSAFGGVGSGTQARDYSDRGSRSFGQQSDGGFQSGFGGRSGGRGGRRR